MKKTILLAILVFSGLLSQAQKEKPLQIGTTVTLHSAFLREDRDINIWLPAGYQPDSISYPVVYLLDGGMQEDFHHITGLVQFLGMTNQMPASIVVGICNKDRKKDFTFPTNNAKDKKAYPTTGGSAAFISFLQQELMPYVKKHYAVNTQRTVMGQSLGGLVAVEILTRFPEMFNNYMIVSPSLWWDDESLLKKVTPVISKYVGTPLRISISVGKEGKVMEEDAKSLYQNISAAGNKRITVSFTPMDAENHLTILHNAAYKSLSWLSDTSAAK
ncbi:MAG: alpha/beta hydrolase [Chitinophaga sp.]|uniref:alpha/beta hydrolase n=1 Tax=Chitinophaga sp. TaxID=1869181 RepID=UPI0025C2292A|nr:alpha/beta hydrolase-fold protein [Chitinophaga sp.]MBV8252122.1 alpha/beta hydrolase [Chitinophaga sp.]